MKELLILGAGTAGTMMANKMVRSLAGDWRVTVVDRDPDHVYQPGLLFVPFGDHPPAHLARPRAAQLDPRVRFLAGDIRAITPAAKSVEVEGHGAVAYDLLVLATGAVLHPERTPGLTGPGWREDMHEFYTLEGATALAERLDGWQGGRLVVNFMDLPIKCPVAPLEFAFLADAWLTKRGLRERTQLVFATPLDGAFTKPKASAHLGGLLARKGIEVVPNVQVASVDGTARRLEAYDGRTLDFDLLVTVPLHGGIDAIGPSGLGDDLGFVRTDRHTLQALGHDDIFAIGDCTDLPASKAGAVAHFQSHTLESNLLRRVLGRPLLPGFDGHTNCFIETGHGQAMLIDFNYETEPLPGRFPLPGIGPFKLLEESPVNHWGKLAFEWAYWNVLLRGDELPMDHRMLMHGKWS